MSRVTCESAAACADLASAQQQFVADVAPTLLGILVGAIAVATAVDVVPPRFNRAMVASIAGFILTIAAMWLSYWIFDTGADSQLGRLYLVFVWGYIVMNWASGLLYLIKWWDIDD